MPATVTSHARANKSTTKAAAPVRAKKPRVVRRRGRAGIESDDEIEREAQTDSDTDEESSFSSESDSESVSDDEHQPGIVTPSTTQSPPALDIPGAAVSVKPEPHVNGTSTPFAGTTDWAQIVADENADGPGDLPVIDFADMHPHSAIPEPARPARPARKAQKHKKKASVPHGEHPPAAAPEDTATAPAAQETKQDEHEAPAEEPVASTSRTASREPPVHRARTQSARQAYQERLQADPAFVPRVGEFWGHDDRLLDKEYRSLSNWWRDRWDFRGRGRGSGMRGRGGRGFHQGRAPPHLQGNGEAQAQEEEKEKEKEVASIDREWTHDGFEEMKRREDQRKEAHRRSQSQQSSTPQSPSQRGGPFRGRGGLAARGRGGFARGAAFAPAFPRPGPRSEPWYAMKPEKVWTKHADGFLYTDPAVRPRAGDPNIKVKLPGSQGQVVRAKKQVSTPQPSEGPTATTKSAASSEVGGRHVVVRMPRPQSTKEAPPSSAEDTPASNPATELSIEEVFTVRPHAVPEHIPLQSPVRWQSAQQIPVVIPTATHAPVEAKSDAQRQLEQVGLGISHPSASNEGPSPTIQESVLRNPPRSEEGVITPETTLAEGQTDAPVAPPSLTPLQTTFAPAPQQSPPYGGSPYSFAPALPPGVAMSHQGYPYEVATGRPVYLANPPPMYAPQPMMPPYMAHPPGPMPFVPGHMHHPSQEYMQPHTPHPPPTNGFIAPNNGVPIFSPARQSSRIEIRTPTGEVKSIKPAHRPSGLRTATTNDEQSQNEGAPTEQTVPDGQQQEAQLQHQPLPHPPQPLQPQPDPSMMAYMYQQPYYYPDPNGYPGYMDMSPQVMQYDLYPQHYDQHAPQPVIYY